MAKDLIVGSFDLPDLESSITEFLESRGGVEGAINAWLKRPEEIVTISCLNVATVAEFLRHTIICEGYQNEALGFSAGQDGKLKANYPWWENSVWLPLDFGGAGTLDDDQAFFVGSCSRLIGELEELKRISPLRLGEAPAAYYDMRSNFDSFVSSSADLSLSREDCVRWVWMAFRDGAELAIAENAPLWAGPD